MAYSIQRAKFESELAAAHRRLFRAKQAAAEMNDLGAEHDVEQILREVTRVAQSSLTGRARRVREQGSPRGV